MHSAWTSQPSWTRFWSISVDSIRRILPLQGTHLTLSLRTPGIQLEPVHAVQPSIHIPWYSQHLPDQAMGIAPAAHLRLRYAFNSQSPVYFMDSLSLLLSSRFLTSAKDLDMKVVTFWNPDQKSETRVGKQKIKRLALGK